ncbi:MAG: sigma-70 family RNA polymerase sigma factor [Ruminiclostridium sp.]|nr:sigma-70 family RNA polymerase sigma factor [Ruminiclostridium sp.]
MQDKVKAAQKGNDQAFYWLISRYKGKLYNTARYFLNSEAEALEAVHEVTYRAFIHIKRLREPDRFYSWLGRIMYNYCMDVLKRSNRVIPIENIENLEQEDTTTLKLEIGSYMSQLRPDFRKVIILKYFDDLSIEEISEKMSRPEGTVKTWLSRGLGQLKKIMERT